MPIEEPTALRQSQAAWLAVKLNLYLDRLEAMELCRSVPGGYEVSTRELEDGWVLVLDTPLGDELFDATFGGAAQLLSACNVIFNFAKAGLLTNWLEELETAESAEVAAPADTRTGP